MSDHTTSPDNCKPCNWCGEVKPFSQFPSDSSRPGGRKKVCTTCVNARRRELRRDNPEKYRSPQRAYLDAHRDEINQKRRDRAVDRRSEINARDRAWRSKNRDRVNKERRERYHKRSDFFRERAKQWRQANQGKKRAADLRRKTLQRSLPANFTDKDWQRALGYFNDRCAICGNPIGLWHTLAREHWIPVTDPRPDNPGTVPANILPMCHSKRHGEGGCNNIKHNKDPEQWLIERFGNRKAKVISKRIHDYFEWVVEQQ